MARYYFAFVLPVVIIALSGCGDKTERAAYACFRVDTPQRLILTGQPAMTLLEAERYRNNLAVLITSPQVLEAALRSSGAFQGLPMPQSELDWVDWLADHLRVEIEEGTDILKISLVHKSAPREAMVAAVEAVSDAFLEEILLKERIRSRQPRDILAESYKDLSDEIRRKSEAYYSLLADSGSVELPSMAARVDLMIAQIGRLEEEKLAKQRRLFEERLRLRLSGAESDDAGESIAILAQEYAAYLARLEEQIESLTQQVMDHSQPDTELLARKREIDGLQKVESMIAEQIECWDVELNRPDRVTSLGGADFEEP